MEPTARGITTFLYQTPCSTRLRLPTEVLHHLLRPLPHLLLLLPIHRPVSKHLALFQTNRETYLLTFLNRSRRPTYPIPLCHSLLSHLANKQHRKKLMSIIKVALLPQLQDLVQPSRNMALHPILTPMHPTTIYLLHLLPNLLLLGELDLLNPHWQMTQQTLVCLMELLPSTFKDSPRYLRPASILPHPPSKESTVL